jgi:hypothetical protein
MEITSSPKVGRHAKESRSYRAIVITSIGVVKVVAGYELVNGTGVDARRQTTRWKSA